MEDEQSIQKESVVLQARRNRELEQRRKKEKRNQKSKECMRRKRAAAKQRKASKKKVRATEINTELTQNVVDSGPPCTSTVGNATFKEAAHDDSQNANAKSPLHLLDSKPASETLVVEERAVGLPDIEEAAFQEHMDDEQRDSQIPNVKRSLELLDSKPAAETLALEE